MPMHADKVSRIMFAAQIAVLVAGAGAVAMFLANPFQDPDSIVEARTAADVDRPRPDTQRRERAEPAFEHTDWQVVLPAIGWAAPDPVERTTVEDEEASRREAESLAGEGPQRPEDIPPPESRPLVNWRYIGYLRQTETIVALLHMNERQRFVNVGDVLDDHRVTSISPEAVVINDGVREQRIQLAARSDTLPGAASPLGPGARPRLLPRLPEDASEEDLERLRERESIERERERVLERMRQNPFRTEEWTPS